MLLRFLFTLVFFLPMCLYAQDTLYMRDGRIVDCEINDEDTSFIYLKRFEQRSGDLTLAKALVSKIKYRNGSVASVPLPWSERDPYEPASTIISISPIVNFSGLGGGITLEIPIVKNKVTFFLPCYYTGYSFKSGVSVLQIMPAIKYYPGRKMGRSKERYAIGLQLLFQSGSYSTHETSSGGNFYVMDNDAFSVGLLVNNSINYFSGRHLYVGFDLAPGISLISDSEFPVLLHFNMRFGYRFK